LIKAGPEAVEKMLNDKEEQIMKMVEQENNGCRCSCKKKLCVSEKANASGKAITDDNFFSDMTNYLQQKKNIFHTKRIYPESKDFQDQQHTNESKTLNQWIIEKHWWRRHSS
jgi:hypothetical protein